MDQKPKECFLLYHPFTFYPPPPPFLPRDGIEAVRLSVDEMKGKLPNESVGTMGSRVVSDAWVWMGCALHTLVVCCYISIETKLKCGDHAVSVVEIRTCA